MSSESEAAGESVARRIEVMEEAYEFMLAYAAQGVVSEMSTEGEDIGFFLQRMAAALDGLAAAAAAEARDLPPGVAEACGIFIEVLADDAVKTLTAVRLILALSTIGSQLIDNFNANIHLRAVLADLFLLDEILRAGCRSDRAQVSAVG